MWATGGYGYLSDYLWWWFALASLAVHTWCFFRFLRPKIPPWVGLALGNTLVTLCLLTTAGLVAETYLRFVSTSTDAMGATLTSKRWFLAYSQENSMYFRDVEWSTGKPIGTHRLAFVGDSFTSGWGIKNRSDRFSDLIQAHFSDRSREAGIKRLRHQPTVEVMNMAWNGWGTQQQLTALRELVPTYAIDEIVLCYLPNDMNTRIPITDGYDPTQPPKNTLVNTTSSFLLDFLYHRIYARRLAAFRGYHDWLWNGFQNRSVWEKHASDLSGIVELCNEHHVKLRVVIFPFLRTCGDLYDARAIHTRVQAFFEERNIPTLDLLDLLSSHDPETLVLNPHDPHPNETAHRLMAEAIWKAFYSHPQAPSE